MSNAAIDRDDRLINIDILGALRRRKWIGLIIGVIGTTVGASAGYVLSTLMTRYKLIRVPADVYQMSYVPFRVLATDMLVVVLGAVLICFVATIYPSRQAAKLDPVQALRYE